MLKEVTLRNKENRRWYSDDYFDLIVWPDDAETTIRGIQLCYDKHGSERALSWWKDQGFSHEKVDDGETNPGKNLSPILIPDGACPIQELLELFLNSSTQIEEEIRKFVLKKLKEYEVGDGCSRN